MVSSFLFLFCFILFLFCLFCCCLFWGVALFCVCFCFVFVLLFGFAWRICLMSHRCTMYILGGGGCGREVCGLLLLLSFVCVCVCCFALFFNVFPLFYRFCIVLV